MIATLLLGAGASADAGIQYGDELERKLAKQIHLLDKCDAADAWEYISRHAATFEDRYRLARDLSRMSRLGLADPPIQDYQSALDYLAGHEGDHEQIESPGCISPLIAEILGTSDVKDLSYLDPIAELVREQGRVTISSINYDCVIETWSASQHALFLQDDNLDSWRPGHPWPEPKAAPIQLLKLHGSADWEWQSRVPFGDRLLDSPFVRLKKPGNHRLDPAIILGAGNKLRAGGPYLALLEAFTAALDSAEHLIIVGYSFRDIHINTRIADWFDSEPVHRFITVLDPAWPCTSESDTYRSSFAEMLDHRLRLIEPGPTSFNGIMGRNASPTPRLRIIRKTAAEGLAEALADPAIENDEIPVFRLTQNVRGRSDQRLRYRPVTESPDSLTAPGDLDGTRCSGPES